MPPLLPAMVVVAAVGARQVVVRRRREDERERLRRFVAVIERDPDVDDPAAGASPSRATGVDATNETTAPVHSHPAVAAADLPTFADMGGMVELKQALAATNDLDHLDPAVIRPGRFDRQVRVDMPDREGRRAILEVQLARRPSTESTVDLDAIGRTRGQGAGSGIGDRQLTQLLAEIDGIASSDGVLVVGATNRPDALDPALTRGGRLSRTIQLPLPDEALRRAMLARMTARMPTVGVDLARVAAVIDGLSGADLQAVCQQAALHALVRMRGAGDPDAAVEILPEDVARAILEARG